MAEYVAAGTAVVAISAGEELGEDIEGVGGGKELGGAGVAV